MPPEPHVRPTGVLGASNQAARVGGIVAPFIALAGTTHNSSLIPFLTFGIAALLSGILIFTLPETLGVPLPDTMQDMDNIASIFTHHTYAKKGLKAAAASMFKPRVQLPKQQPRSSWLRAGGRGGADGSDGGGGGEAGGAAAAVHGGGVKKGKQEQTSVWAEDEVGAVPEEEGSSLIGVHRPPPRRSDGCGGGGADAGSARV
jgi:hypothetical protein